MPRLTRAESQARTRELLIETAKRLFLQDGYAATSLEKVAEEAGFSKGAVYSNFSGKDDLCLAVLDTVRVAQVTEIAGILLADEPFERQVTALQDWADRTLGTPGWTTLEMELAIQARRDPALRETIARRARTVMDDALVAHIGERLAAGGLKARLPVEELMRAMLALGVGLGVRRLVDPEMPVSVFTETLRVLVGAGDRPAGPRS